MNTLTKKALGISFAATTLTAGCSGGSSPEAIQATETVALCTSAFANPLAEGITFDEYQQMVNDNEPDLYIEFDSSSVGSVLGVSGETIESNGIFVPADCDAVDIGSIAVIQEFNLVCTPMAVYDTPVGEAYDLACLEQ